MGIEQVQVHIHSLLVSRTDGSVGRDRVKIPRTQDTMYLVMFLLESKAQPDG